MLRRRAHPPRRTADPGRPRRRGESKDSLLSPGEAGAVAGVLVQIAHDLRSPLGSLVLWLSTLRKECSAARVAGESLPMVESAAHALDRLSRDLDDAARILQGTLKVQIRPVELVPLLERLRERTHSRAEARAIQVRMTLRKGRVVVAADSDRLDRLLDAVVRGALAAASQGDVAEIGLEVETGTALVSIAPPPLELPVVPGLEEQLGAGTPARGGPGLPLALVPHLLEAQGGALEALPKAWRLRLPLFA